MIYLRSSPTHDIPGADGTFGNTVRIKEKKKIIKINKWKSKPSWSRSRCKYMNLNAKNERWRFKDTKEWIFFPISHQSNQPHSSLSHPNPEPVSTKLFVYCGGEAIEWVSCILILQIYNHTRTYRRRQRRTNKKKPTLNW